eukprot:Em0001g3064a
MYCAVDQDILQHQEHQPPPLPPPLDTVLSPYRPPPAVAAALPPAEAAAELPPAEAAAELPPPPPAELPPPPAAEAGAHQPHHRHQY